MAVILRYWLLKGYYDAPPFWDENNIVIAGTHTVSALGWHARGEIAGITRQSLSNYMLCTYGGLVGTPAKNSFCQQEAGRANVERDFGCLGVTFVELKTPLVGSS